MEIARRDHQTLSRIAAMLLALAVLAERAGSRSFPVRWFVLSILWHAEAVARAFVVAETQMHWPCIDDDRECRPVDAAWLAFRFRALAAMLGALLPRTYGFECCRIDCAPRRFAHPLYLFFIIPGGWALAPDDTS